MKFYNLLFLLFTLNNLSAQTHKNNQCVIKDKVIDMGVSYHTEYGNVATPNEQRCYRAHQGLYGEIVELVKECDWDENQLFISIPNIIYGFSPFTNQGYSTFYTYKKHLVPLNQLSDDALKAIPCSEYAEKPTIVLTYPWNNFSIGTRFTHVSENDTENSFGVAYIDFENDFIVFNTVPRENAIQEIKLDTKSKQKLFVEIINNLINKVAQTETTNIIPCIFGGSSFIEPYKNSDFYQNDGVWCCNEKNDPYCGYDSSEFLMRMTKIAGIDFPWKTTAAIGCSLKTFDSQDTLQEGDILWVQGLAMIVSNLERNEIITCRSHSSGYGCVHRVKLSDCLHDIATFDQLLNLYYTNNNTLQFKNKDGSVAEKIYDFKFLKLMPSNK